MLGEKQEDAIIFDAEEIQHNALRLNDFLSLFIKNDEQANMVDTSRTLLYRGQADRAFNLSPSVFRKNRLVNEHKMIQKLLLRSPADFMDVKNPFEQLVKMQHYKLSTRLLDVTFNPLVALYFACEDCFDKDGEIIVFFDYIKSHNDMDVRILSTLSEYSGKSEQGMRTFLNERGFSTSIINTSELLKTPYVLVEPPMNNERIMRQSGAFALVGIRQDAMSFEKEAFNLRELVVFEDNEEIERSIIVPKESKETILKELDVIGINRAFLFPELEHQATYITNKYEEG